MTKKSTVQRLMALGTLPLAVLIAACDPQDAFNPSRAGGDETSTTQTAQERDIVGYDGSAQRLAVVGSGNSATLRGDTTKQTDTPPIVPQDILTRCGLPATWGALEECMRNETWYHQGFATMAPYDNTCGMKSWSDVKRYAAARLPGGQEIPALLIHVIGPNPVIDGQPVTVESAKRVIKEQYNIDTATMTVVFHEDIVNSRGLEERKISPFLDQKNQVRLSLAPIIFDDEGRPSKLCSEGGVMDDCLNIWGKARGIAPAQTTPTRPKGTGTPSSGTTPSGTGTPPPGSSTTTPGSSTTTAPPTTTQPPSTTPPVTTTPPPSTTEPPVTTTNDSKVPTQIPGSGGEGDGGSGQYGGTGGQTQTASPSAAPPAAAEPSATYVPLPVPTEEPAPAPPVVTMRPTTPAATPEPKVQPSTQSQTTSMEAPAPGSGEFG